MFIQSHKLVGGLVQVLKQLGSGVFREKVEYLLQMI